MRISLQSQQGRLLLMVLLSVVSTIAALLALVGLLRNQTDESFLAQQRVMNRFVTLSASMSLTTNRTDELMKIFDDLERTLIFHGAILYDSEGTRLLARPTGFEVSDETTARVMSGEEVRDGKVLITSGRLLDGDSDQIGTFLVAFTSAPMHAQASAATWTIAAIITPILLLLLGLLAFHVSRAERAVQVAGMAEAESNLAKTEFLANMSHEIRTPMNGVLGFVDLLLESDLTDTQRDHLETVQRSAECLLCVLNQILDFSKIDVEKLELDTVRFDLSEVVEQVAASQAPQAKAKGVEFFSGVATPFGTWFRGDPTRIRQVLLNLAQNAVKFTTDGEIAIRVRLVAAEGERMRVQFKVSDTGIGISPDRHACLFEPFRQVDGSMTREFGGTGLGLAISRGYVELMGGEISVVSKVGEGSEFSFELCLEPAISETENVGSRGLAGLKVLIVDDNATHRDILSEVLQSVFCEVVAVPSASEAVVELSKAAHSNQPFSILLIDREMPNTNGIELRRKLSANPELRDIPCILLTSNDVESQQEAHRHGFVTAMPKPLRRTLLLREILKATNRYTASEDTSPRITSNRRASPQRILLAEDNPWNQQLALAVLKRGNHIVDVVNNGMEAVRAVSKKEYDIILMDVQMPGMNGLEATRRIRESSDFGRDVPIIAVTARALEGDREQCLLAGMNDCLTKPLRTKDLDAIIVEFASNESKREPLESGEHRAINDRLDSLGILDDPESAREILTLFITTARDLIATLEESLERGDSTACRDAAHSLNGASRNLGAAKLGALSQALECAGSVGELFEAGQLLDRIRSEALQVEQFLEELLARG